MQEESKAQSLVGTDNFGFLGYIWSRMTFEAGNVKIQDDNW